jgi:hypothetical protein
MILQVINGMGTCFVGHPEIVAALWAARFPPHSKLWCTQWDFSKPCEVDLLVGDARKAKQTLEWEAKTTFKDLVSLMVNADMFALQRPGLQRR